MSFVQTDLRVEGKSVVCTFFHTLLHSFITMIDWALKNNCLWHHIKQYSGHLEYAIARRKMLPVA